MVRSLGRAVTSVAHHSAALPSIHPSYGASFSPRSLPVLISGAADTAIPTTEGGANHTPEFTKSAATPEAHRATLQVAKGLSAVGFRVLADNAFFAEVCRSGH